VIRLEFRPPQDDPSWDAWVRDGLTAMQQMLDQPSAKRVIKDALYKRQRDRFLEATHWKCAYCELPLPAGQGRGDVEHYRPKGRVRNADGTLVTITVDGVRRRHPGYYWLAYDFRNLLPACSACNQRGTGVTKSTGTRTGKGEIFPTLDDRWASRPEELADEHPALLNPWSDDPDEHLVFDPFTGLVAGLTPRGRVTIDVLGLNRDGLPEDRKKACTAVRNAMKNIVTQAWARGPDDEDVDLLRSVRVGSAPFAAISRVQREMLWRQLTNNQYAFGLTDTPADEVDDPAQRE
jgi:hypothetical protein